MKGNLIFALICLAVLGVVVFTRGGVAPTPPALQTSAATLDEALNRAQGEGKVVFAVATADWCGPCQSYKRGALASGEVADWLATHAVTLTMDVTDRQNPDRDALTLGVGAIPATFLINSDGELLARTEGILSRDNLLAWLDKNAG